MLINKCRIYVEQIRSYQTLIYKNGFRTFPKKAYKDYKEELHAGMVKLKPIEKDVPVALKITFNVKEAYEPSCYRVKMKETGNTSKLFNNKEEAEEWLDPDKHELEYVPPVVKYGSVGDFDNASKPVVDYLEEMGIISNDRYAVHVLTYKTFGNERESIDIEIKELEVVENGNVSFKEKL